MPVLMTLEAPGGTTAQYDHANAVIGIAAEGGLPPGLVVHTCAVTDDGIVVVDVWDSASSFEDFARDRLGAALKEAGLASGSPRISPIHSLLFGTGEEPNVLVLLLAYGVTADDYDALVARMPSYDAGGENHPAVMHVAGRAGRVAHRRPLGLGGGVQGVRTESAVPGSRDPAVFRSPRLARPQLLPCATSRRRLTQRTSGSRRSQTANAQPDR
jgi:hypothetical protein